MSIPDAVLAALAGGAGIVIAKILDVFMSRTNSINQQNQLTLERQKELDNVKDTLIIAFQTQVNELRQEVNALIDKNTQLHEKNIEYRYKIAELEFRNRSNQDMKKDGSNASS